MANELSRTEYFIEQQLKNDATTAAIVGTRIFGHTIPQAATAATITYPCVLFTYLSSRDVQAVNVRRAMTRALYQIVVICKGPADDNARTVADQIDTLIGFARTVQYSINGIGYVFNGIREQPISLAELTLQNAATAVRYHRLGGEYRIETYAS